MEDGLCLARTFSAPDPNTTVPPTAIVRTVILLICHASMSTVWSTVFVAVTIASTTTPSFISISVLEMVDVRKQIFTCLPLCLLSICNIVIMGPFLKLARLWRLHQYCRWWQWCLPPLVVYTVVTKHATMNWSLVTWYIVDYTNCFAHCLSFIFIQHWWRPCNSIDN